MIESLAKAAVIAASRSALLGSQVPRPDSGSIVNDDPFVGEMVRRGAAIHCPCTKPELRYAVQVALRGLLENYDDLEDLVEHAIDALILVGDLVEVRNRPGQAAEPYRSTLTVGAPSFITRKSGSTLIVGGSSDDGALPKSIAERIEYSGPYRLLPSGNGNTLVKELKHFGFTALDQDQWLTCPDVLDAEELVRQAKQSLIDSGLEHSRIVDGLSILDTSKDVRRYRSRWGTAEGKSGEYIARRPAAFGAPIWCFVSLQDGSVTRLVDLNQEGGRWRSCDLAWHLQMAMDRLAGTPQVYGRQECGQKIRLDFFAPLPMWAERRLMVFGERVPSKGSLMAYKLSVGEGAEEEAFLKKKLWLEQSDQHRED